MASFDSDLEMKSGEMVSNTFARRLGKTFQRQSLRTRLTSTHGKTIGNNMAVQIGTPVCWGADPRWSTLPIVNLPPDVIKVRRRIRNTNFAKAFVKTSTEVQHWVLLPVGTVKDCTELKLGIRQGMNVRK